MQIRQVGVAQVMDIRQAVLRPGEPPAASVVPGDAQARHFGAFMPDHVAVASLFQVDGVQLRKFAVLPDWQGRGIGAAMLVHLMAQAGDVRFWCDARVAAVPFYMRHGMVVCSAPFQKDGRDYLRMESRARSGGKEG